MPWVADLVRTTAKDWKLDNLLIFRRTNLPDHC
jgi:hypothetical protein